MDAFKRFVCAGHPMCPSSFLDEILQESIRLKDWASVERVRENPKASKEAMDIIENLKKAQ